MTDTLEEHVETDDLKIAVGIEVMGSYKRLSYTVWHAFAEFVDNSTQSYFNNKNELNPIFRDEETRLTIDITYDKEQDTITIVDNSIGMSPSELASALKIGVPTTNSNGRSKYGLGLKTAACWLGDYWTVDTKRFGSVEGIKVDVDVNEIVDHGVFRLPTFHYSSEPEEHYTKIIITKLHKNFHGKTLNKVEEFLKSMYRLDFSDYGLILKWQGKQLLWDGFENRFYITQDGSPYKTHFSFEISNPPKKVVGWVGVLVRGGRKDAGFSIIQNKRVIQGWPDAYRPSSLFGQITGTNDLINQRLVGELYMDDFEVSHTKDSILWENNEEELLEDKLAEICSDARALASSLRLGKDITIDKIERIRNEALVAFESELKSDEIVDKLFVDTIPDERAIQLSYLRLIEVVVSSDEPTIIVTVGAGEDAVTVKVYLRSTSEFEPYLLIETTNNDQTVIIIINILHPYWQELKSVESFLNFIRNCVYDGLSEWRARKKTGKINPDTIRFLKDSLLRLPYEILSNKFESIRMTDQDE